MPARDDHVVRVGQIGGGAHLVAELEVDLALVGRRERVGLPELHGDILADRMPSRTFRGVGRPQTDARAPGAACESVDGHGTAMGRR